MFASIKVANVTGEFYKDALRAPGLPACLEATFFEVGALTALILDLFFLGEGPMDRSNKTPSEASDTLFTAYCGGIRVIYEPLKMKGMKCSPLKFK